MREAVIIGTRLPGEFPSAAGIFPVRRRAGKRFTSQTNARSPTRGESKIRQTQLLLTCNFQLGPFSHVEWVYQWQNYCINPPTKFRAKYSSKHVMSSVIFF